MSWAPGRETIPGVGDRQKAAELVYEGKMAPVLRQGWPDSPPLMPPRARYH